MNHVYVRRIRYDAGAGQHVGLSRAPDNHRDLYGVLNDGRYWLGSLIFSGMTEQENVLVRYNAQC